MPAKSFPVNVNDAIGASLTKSAIAEERLDYDAGRKVHLPAPAIDPKIRQMLDARTFSPH